MKIEEGKWIRNHGDIFQVKYCKCEQCKVRGFLEPIVKYGSHNDYITSQKMWDEYIKESVLANTPQELIEVGDLVIFMYEEDTVIFNDIISSELGAKSIQDTIVLKILTPNANGGYDLQWEENK